MSTSHIRAALAAAGAGPVRREPTPAELATEVLGQYFTAEDIREGLAEGGSIAVTVFEHGCPWCAGNATDRAWPACTCRTLCGTRQCLPSIPAGEVKVGRTYDYGGTVLRVIAVSPPDAEDMVTITHLGGLPVRVAADWPLTEVTS